MSSASFCSPLSDCTAVEKSEGMARTASYRKISLNDGHHRCRTRDRTRAWEDFPGGTAAHSVILEDDAEFEDLPCQVRSRLATV